MRQVCNKNRVMTRTVFLPAVFNSFGSLDGRMSLSTQTSATLPCFSGSSYPQDHRERREERQTQSRSRLERSKHTSKCD